MLVVLLLVLFGGFSVLGALVQVILVILVLGVVVWFISILSGGGSWYGW